MLYPTALIVDTALCSWRSFLHCSVCVRSLQTFTNLAFYVANFQVLQFHVLHFHVLHF